MCGEHETGERYRHKSRGSSPRVRGTRKIERLNNDGTGIIPACAGNTDARREREPHRGDHPRVCGEHGDEFGEEPLESGSSPRVRGTLVRAAVATVLSGIIPACAGNTFVPRTPLMACRDHPRVCGEHFRYRISAFPARGSSPRVRGTRRPAGPSFRDRGIIPACAGNTGIGTSMSPPSRDHPRVCGEHDYTANDIVHCKGSSPRVRGTLARPDQRRTCHGIIPACAGNTKK